MAANRRIVCGYEHQFVDDVSAYGCPMCEKVLRNPFTTACGDEDDGCGKTVCKGCLIAHFDVKGRKVCPFCESEDIQYVPSKQINKKIKSLRVRCTNAAKGCEWKGQLSLAEDHLQECRYVEMECPNKCGIAAILRKDCDGHLRNHCVLRPYQCEYCDLEDTYQAIIAHHADCPEFPLQCPNDCGERAIPRKDIQVHRQRCPLEMIVCPNMCGIEVQRKDIESHHIDICELRPATCKYCHLKDTHKNITVHIDLEECEDFPMICPLDCGAKDIKRRDMPDHRRQCPNESITCKYMKVGCRITLKRGELDDHLSNSKDEHLAMAMQAYEDLHNASVELITELAQAQEKNEDLIQGVMFDTGLIRAASAGRGSKNMKELALNSLRLQANPECADVNQVSLRMLRYSHYLEKKSIWTSHKFYLGPVQQTRPWYLDVIPSGIREEIGPYVSIKLRGCPRLHTSWLMHDEISITVIQQNQFSSHNLSRSATIHICPMKCSKAESHEAGSNRYEQEVEITVDTFLSQNDMQCLLDDDSALFVINFKESEHFGQKFQHQPPKYKIYCSHPCLMND